MLAMKMDIYEHKSRVIPAPCRVCATYAQLFIAGADAGIRFRYFYDIGLTSL